MVGAFAPALMANVRRANDRVPVSQPVPMNAYPACVMCPDATPGDMSDWNHPSNCWPSADVLPGQGTESTDCEFSISCGTLQSSSSRLVAVEKYHPACDVVWLRHTKVSTKTFRESTL